MGGAGGQAPQFFIFGLHAHCSAERVAEGGDCGAAQHACVAALANPFGRRSVSPSAAVTVMLPRKRMTKSNFNSSVNTRYSL